MTAKRRSSSSKATSKPSKISEESESSDEDMKLEEMEEMLQEGDSSENEDSEEEVEQEEDNDDDVTSEEDVEEVDEEEEEDSESDESNDQEDEKGSSIVQNKFGEEKCTLDLRNLLAFNSHQVNYRTLYSKVKKEEESECTIDVEGSKKANEAYLLQLASEGCTQLLAGLWELETEKTDVGPMAILPSYFETITPRALVSLSCFVIEYSYVSTAKIYLLTVCT